MNAASLAKRLFPSALRPAALSALARASRLGAPRRLREQAKHFGALGCRVLGGEMRGMLFLNPVGQRSPAYVIGWFESHIAGAIKRYVRPGDAVYDIGANVGFHALRLARQVGPQGKVYCFEPSPSDRAALEANLRLNSLANVDIESRAVSDSIGERSFSVFASPGVHHLTRDDSPTDGAAIVVDTTSLDHFVFVEGRRPPSFMKIDVEGGEVDVLRGASRLLTEVQPVIVVEARIETTLPALLGIADEHGYASTRLTDGGDGVCDVLMIPPRLRYDAPASEAESPSAPTR